METESSRHIPVSVLTGFLGSGKTTVLNHLIKQPELSRTLVLINEFGKIGLDHDLVVSGEGDGVIEMASGCLCCTFRADLVKVLRDAPWRFSRGGETWFDRVVIETTGIADPAPILHTLMTDNAIVRRYRLDGVITAVDAVNGGDALNTHLECVKQVSVADRLLLTKTDLGEPASTEALKDRLHKLNPAAPQIVVAQGEVDPARLFDAGLYNPATKSLNVQNWLKAEAYDSGSEQSSKSGPVSRHDARINSVCFTIDDPLPGPAFDAWLGALTQFSGANLLRIKGILNVQDVEGPMVIHGVQHIFHPPVTLPQWPSDDHRSRLVFITYGIDEGELLAPLKTLMDEANAQVKVSAEAWQ